MPMGLFKKITGVWRTIFGRKSTHTVLKESENRYRALFDSIHESVFVCDFERGFLDANARAIEEYGYSKEELLTMAPRDIVAPEHMDDLSTLKEEVVKTGHIIFETVHRRQDGVRLPVEISSRIIEFDGNPALISIVRSISKRKQTEEQIRKSERLTGVLEMAGTVCHELNQPLQAILGYSQLLMFDIDINDPLYSKAEMIVEQVNRMKNINSKLMKVTEYETKYYLQEKIIDIDKASRGR